MCNQSGKVDWGQIGKGFSVKAGASPFSVLGNRGNNIVQWKEYWIWSQSDQGLTPGSTICYLCKSHDFSES